MVRPELVEDYGPWMLVQRTNRRRESKPARLESADVRHAKGKGGAKKHAGTERVATSL